MLLAVSAILPALLPTGSGLEPPFLNRFGRRDAVSSARRFALLAAGTALRPLLAGADDSAAEADAPAPLEVAAPAPPPEPPAPPAPSAFDFSVPFRGEPEPLGPFLGRATLVVNVKFDDPETVKQLPNLQGFVDSYAKQGLRVLAFPTDQGWFEADDSDSLRLKFKSTFGFGQFPVAMVFDKADLLGGNAIPLYRWLTGTMSNPWGINRLVFNYEKFLLDAQARPQPHPGCAVSAVHPVRSVWPCVAFAFACCVGADRHALPDWRRADRCAATRASTRSST